MSRIAGSHLAFVANVPHLWQMSCTCGSYLLFVALIPNTYLTGNFLVTKHQPQLRELVLYIQKQRNYPGKEIVFTD